MAFDFNIMLCNVRFPIKKSTLVFISILVLRFNGYSQSIEVVPQASHQEWVDNVEFHPTKDLLISQGATIKFWNIKNGKLLKTLKTVGFDLNALDISSDGSLLATAGAENIFYIYHLNGTGDIDTIVHSKEQIFRRVYEIKFLNNHRIAVGYDFGHIKIFDTKTGSLLKTYEAHRATPQVKSHVNLTTTLDIDEISGLIYSSNFDGYVKVFDTIQEKEKYSKRLHYEKIQSASVSTQI